MSDLIHTFSKTIIGARFASNTREAATAAMVQCVPLDEIYFVNDPYANFCREFLREWDDERSLPDPNPDMSVEQVSEMYIPTHPEITTATVKGSETVDGKLRYTLSRAIGYKG